MYLFSLNHIEKVVAFVFATPLFIYCVYKIVCFVKGHYKPYLATCINCTSVYAAGLNSYWVKYKYCVNGKEYTVTYKIARRKRKIGYICRIFINEEDPSKAVFKGEIVFWIMGIVAALGFVWIF